VERLLAALVEPPDDLQADWDGSQEARHSGGGTRTWFEAVAPGRIDAWRQFAAAGDARALCLVAECRLLGVGVESDHAGAFTALGEAAEVGCLPALVNQGMMLEAGIGVEKDADQALSLFRWAGDVGDARAQANFALACRHDTPAWAALLTRRAAEGGSGKAQGTLATMLLSGEGVAQDVAEGIAWLRLAAERGLASAQDNLASAYDSGIGVAADAPAAFSWSRKAAAQGVARACHRVGLRYAAGEGDAPSLRRARLWLLRAADAGLQEAAVDLGRLGGPLRWEWGGPAYRVELFLSNGQTARWALAENTDETEGRAAVAPRDEEQKLARLLADGPPGWVLEFTPAAELGRGLAELFDALEVEPPEWHRALLAR
jgi:TPR repeat protein